MNNFISRLVIFLILTTGLAATAFSQDLVAIIETTNGTMHVELNHRAAPTTVANFVNLAQRGFYDGLKFHRVERNFMVQGGDPQGTGRGGPGYEFSGEIILHHSRPGIISMANSGPGTDGSQFFITHVATPHLDGIHSVFGRVTEGVENIYKIKRGDIINSIVIVGDASALFERKKLQVDQWNQILDEGFSQLLPARTGSQ
jgi:peptidyl-prolyl cis-trans isomerase B (cyclophilin B)